MATNTIDQRFGYIYCLKNPVFRLDNEFVRKIGLTVGPINVRMDELYSTDESGVPTPFECEAGLRVRIDDDSTRLKETERGFHMMLRDYFVGREFFKVSLDQIIGLFDLKCGLSSGTIRRLTTDELRAINSQTHRDIRRSTAQTRAPSIVTKRRQHVDTDDTEDIERPIAPPAAARARPIVERPIAPPTPPAAAARAGPVIGIPALPTKLLVLVGNGQDGANLDEAFDIGVNQFPSGLVPGVHDMPPRATTESRKTAQGRSRDLRSWFFENEIVMCFTKKGCALAQYMNGELVYGDLTFPGLEKFAYAMIEAPGAPLGPGLLGNGWDRCKCIRLVNGVPQWVKTNKLKEN